MAKADKNNKKTALKKAEPTKAKPSTVPISSAEILAKVAAKISAQSSDESSDESNSGQSSSDESNTNKGKVPASLKTTPAAARKATGSSDDSSDASSEDSDSDKEIASVPAKTSPHKGKKAFESSNDSSDASSSEESLSEDSDGDKEMTSVPTEISRNNGKKTSDSEDDSSDASESSSKESSSESDSDEEEEPSVPVQTAPAEAIKKRKADGESVGVPKKVKFANDSADAGTSSGETKSIFVGRLSWNVDNDWLAQEFAECGEVESAHVQMDRNTGRSRGFGYVHFKNTHAVEKALALDGKEIDGRAVHIDKSNPPDKKATAEKRAKAFGDEQSPPSAVLFVGNLSWGINEDALWETFGEHGDVKSIRLPTDRETGKPKGFAYVEFSEVGTAKKAHVALQGFELDGRPIRLDFSQPRDSAGGRGGGQGSRGRGGRGGFDFNRGRGGGRGGHGGDRGGGGRGRGRGQGRGARTGGITKFEGQKITFD